MQYLCTRTVVAEFTIPNAFSILIYSSPDLGQGNHTLWQKDAQVAQQNPQYQLAVEQSQRDIFSLRSLENELRRQDERYSKFADWVATDSGMRYGITYYNYDEDLANSMMENHNEKMKYRYDHVALERMHYAFRGEIAKQRQLLECCVVLHDMM